MGRRLSDWSVRNVRALIITVTAVLTALIVVGGAYAFLGSSLGILEDEPQDEDNELWSDVVPSADWDPHLVDTETWPDSMAETAVAVDSQNHPHIAYYGNLGKLLYATNSGGSWERQVIDNAGYRASIAVDISDGVHICYYSTGYNIDTHRDDHPPSLKYASSVNGWTPTIIESLDDGSYMTSIATDSLCGVHIAYFRQEPYGTYKGSLRYATNAGGSWSIDTVEASGGAGQYFGEYCSIALDSSDRVHIAYENFVNTNPGVFDPDPVTFGILRYATGELGDWEIETVESVGVTYRDCALSVDKNDEVHLAFVAATGASSSNSYLKYAHLSGGFWEIESIVNNTLTCSIATDSNCRPHILYLAYLENVPELRYLNDLAGTWKAYSVDDSDLYFRGSDLAIDSANHLHASYYCDIEGHTGLKYATDS